MTERLIADGHHVVGLAREASNFPGELVRVDLAGVRRAAFMTGQTLYVDGGASIGRLAF